MSANAAAKTATAEPAIALIAAALPGFETLLQEAIAAVRQKVLADGKISSARLEAEQHAAHGLSWLATYVMALRELKAYGERLQAEDRYGAIEDYAHPHRRRRICRADLRRHPDEPGRDRPARGARPVGEGDRRRPQRGGRGADRRGQHAREPRPPRRAVQPERRRGQRRRSRPRRDARSDPLRDAPLLRGGGDAPRP